ncbi:hypothetical protein CBD41_08980 [bacterium TMED181]|nr:alpha-ketoacid dehydrogenase subunit beta [Planctomycetota bacterium]OUW42525.1 MAG: hypothetical protein CBD41_08980 [bacterium TMED181]
MPNDCTVQEDVLYIEALSHALRDEMRHDPNVMLMGQDIAGHGGAFKITKGFLEEFGPQRIRNTPIAESGTIGIATGAAILGQRPVIEMQFADFITCGFNQLVNVAAKMYWRTECAVPLVIRMPGGGGMGAGTFHSQNVESWFLHSPGIKVVSPAFSDDAYRLLRSAIKDPNPVIYFEHKFLYRRERTDLTGADIGDRVVGEANIRRPGKDLTSISWGWMTHKVLEAAEVMSGEGIDIEVIDLPVLSPLDLDPILESVEKTQHVAITHEATRTCGFGAELAAQISDESIWNLDGPIQRITYPDSPSPFNKGLEADRIPSVEVICEGWRKALNF